MSWLCMILRGELFHPPLCMIIHTMHYGCTGHFTWVWPGSSPGSSHPSHLSWVNRRDSKRAYVCSAFSFHGFCIYIHSFFLHCFSFPVILGSRKSSSLWAVRSLCHHLFSTTLTTTCIEATFIRNVNPMFYQTFNVYPTISYHQDLPRAITFSYGLT